MPTEPGPPERPDHADVNQPDEPRPQPPAEGAADTPSGFDRFVAGQDALANEIGDSTLSAPARPSRRAAWLAMGAVALALGLLWLAPGAGDKGTPTAATTRAGDATTPSDPDAATDALAVGKPAPLQFTMKDMNGVDVKLASFKGKVILLNFWATWCGPCRAEIPSLVALQQTYGQDLVVLGVSVDDPLEKLKPYATEMQMNYPVLVGKDRQDVQDAYGPLWGIPVSVFVDRDGKIWKRHSGIASKDQFEKEIKALL
jgi:thiol-disulfide isomerase/thioredoxin